MNHQLIFYTHPRSRGRTARWMLEECQLSYQTELLEYGTTMKSADYLRINPLGKVPALQHGEQIITETAAICAYLADAFPAAKLAPPTSQRGDYYRWLFFAAAPLEQAITHKALGVTLSDEQRGFVGTADVAQLADILAGHLATREYIASDQFTAADVYVGSQIGFGLQFDTLPKLQVLQDYWDRLSARPALVRAAELDDALIPNN
ncbi:MAG: glutathione S-transferase family protein [Gammaproteobacteria bacterium]|jgi:glutathione S-transferase|nr:glutathione S-transferase family protein [Gammaproteobacteria bacterium]